MNYLARLIGTVVSTLDTSFMEMQRIIVVELKAG